MFSNLRVNRISKRKEKKIKPQAFPNEENNAMTNITTLDFIKLSKNIT